MGATNSAIADNDAYITKHLKEIEFDIGDSEVQFIQNGVETMISDIIESIVKHHEDDVKKIKTNWIQNIRASCGNDHVGKSVLREINTDERLIKVGSFYEGTKNYFPDKFNFIFIVGTFEAIGISAISLFRHSKGNEFVSFVRTFLCSSILSEPDKYLFDYSKNHLKFDGILEDLTESPRSIKLQFQYKNANGYILKIRIDLYPCFKVMDTFLTEDTLRQHGVCSSLPRFNHYIVETGSYIIMNFSKISFVETEDRFIKEVLSSHHRTVYRLVKHLINGTDMDRSFNLFCRGCIYNVDLTSRRIKTEIIAHHFACTEKTDFHKGRHIQTCAREIILDLAFQVEACRKRYIVRSTDKRDKSTSDVNIWYNTWYETPESNDFRNFGSNYLNVLGNSLNPGLMTSLFQRYFNIDLCYSQYMLKHRNEFFLEKPPISFESRDNIKQYFSVGRIHD